MLEIAPNVLFSTELIANPIPLQDDWSYYGKKHGQHIGFFSMRTLKWIAKEKRKYLVSDGIQLHYLSEKRINSSIWLIITRLSPFFSWLYSMNLSSKMVSDYYYISENNT